MKNKNIFKRVFAIAFAIGVCILPNSVYASDKIEVSNQAEFYTVLNDYLVCNQDKDYQVEVSKDIVLSTSFTPTLNNNLENTCSLDINGKGHKLSIQKYDFKLNGSNSVTDDNAKSIPKGDFTMRNLIIDGQIEGLDDGYYNEFVIFNMSRKKTVLDNVYFKNIKDAYFSYEFNKYHSLIKGQETLEVKNSVFENLNASHLFDIGGTSKDLVINVSNSTFKDVEWDNYLFNFSTTADNKTTNLFHNTFKISSSYPRQINNEMKYEPNMNVHGNAFLYPKSMNQNLFLVESKKYGLTNYLAKKDFTNENLFKDELSSKEMNGIKYYTIEPILDDKSIDLKALYVPKRLYNILDYKQDGLNKDIYGLERNKDTTQDLYGTVSIVKEKEIIPEQPDSEKPKPEKPIVKPQPTDTCTKDNKDQHGRIVLRQRCHYNKRVAQIFKYYYKGKSKNYSKIEKNYYSLNSNKRLIKQEVYTNYLNNSTWRKRVITFKANNTKNKITNQTTVLRHNNKKYKEQVTITNYANGKKRFYEKLKWNAKGKRIASTSTRYYQNGRKKEQVIYSKYSNGKHRKRVKTQYFENGKKKYREYAYYNKKKQLTSKMQYRYNKNGQLKAGKGLKAWRVKISYKKGKAIKTKLQYYNKAGKLRK